MDCFVEFTQKLDRFEIFSPAIPVRDPLIMLAAVVEIQHGRDGINTGGVFDGEMSV